MKFNRKKLTDAELRNLYEQLLLTRMIEEKMLILLRQNKISKWFSGIGQEAFPWGLPRPWNPMNTFSRCTATWAYSPGARSLCTASLPNGKGPPWGIRKAAIALFILAQTNIISLA